jgi:putative transposase
VGDQPIHGELLHLGVRVSASSIRRVLRAHGLDPPPRRVPTTGAGAQCHAVAERWVGTGRRECLDQLLIVGCRQLARVLRRDVEHYNQRRPHRSLAHATPLRSEPAEATSAPDVGRLRRRDVLGGLIHESEDAA